MKSKEEIQKRLQKQQLSELKRRLHEMTRRSPGNCTHNRVHVEAGRTIGICTFASEAEDWSGLVCDDDQTARECPFFQCRHDEDRIISNLESDLQSGDVPDSVSILQWVLEGEDNHLSWWRKLLAKWF